MEAANDSELRAFRRTLPQVATGGTAAASRKSQRNARTGGGPSDHFAQNRRSFILKAIAATRIAGPKPLRLEYPHNKKVRDWNHFFWQMMTATYTVVGKKRLGPLVERRSLTL